MDQMLEFLYKLHEEYRTTPNKKAFIEETITIPELKAIFSHDLERRKARVTHLKAVEDARRESITKDNIGKQPDNSILSVSIIVKNEAETILNTLLSVTHICNEIVVLDTGSTDGTKKIIKDFKKDGGNVKLIKKEFVPWDFAKARNFCMEHCAGEYVLFIDADEVLIEYDDPTPSLLEIKDDPHAISIPVKLYNHVHNAPIDMYPSTRLNQIRILPNMEEAKWECDLHNNPVFPGTVDIAWGGEDIAIHHVEGKSKTKSRYKRNKKEIKKYKDKNESFRKYYMLTKLYTEQEEKADAYDTALKGLEFYNEMSLEDMAVNAQFLLLLTKAAFQIQDYDCLEWLMTFNFLTGGTADSFFYMHIAFEQSNKLKFAHHAIQKWDTIRKNHDDDPFLVYETLNHELEGLLKLDLLTYWAEQDRSELGEEIINEYPTGKLG